MLILNTASSRQVAYWQRDAVRGTWEGGAARTLGLEGDPTCRSGGASLSALLSGRHPATAAPLTARPGLRRRQGWDLVFAAPKSVSLLVATGVAGSQDVLGAYRHAVTQALEALGSGAALVRLGGRDVPATGWVAGTFEHRSNAAGQAHLHTHVVLPNLAQRPDGAWGCLVGGALWRWREAGGAAFHLSLRAGLRQAGLGFDWHLLPGGLGELAEVPLPARAAASSRSLATRAAAMSFGAPGAGPRRVAQGLSRPVGGTAAATAAAAGGLVEAKALDVLRQARSKPCLPSPPPSVAAVASALAERSSAFTVPDMWVALAETCPGGLSTREAAAWLARARGTWLDDAGPGRLSSTLARRYDMEVLASASTGRFAHLAEVARQVAEAEITALGFGVATASAAMQLACSGHAISVLAPGPWVAQAECLDAARAVWQAAGAQVSVATPSELAARRWQALTGLVPPQAASATAMPAPPQPRRAAGARVLVVDAADHVGPAALARLARGAEAGGTKLVLVVGGTADARQRPAAAAVEHLLAGAAVGPGQWVAPLRGTGPEQVHHPYKVPGLAVQGAPTGRDALAFAVEAAAANRALLVAYGGPEAVALNALAAQGLHRPGPAAVLAGRSFQVGDRVLALRRLGRVPGAARGTVSALDSRCMTVQWHLGGGDVTAVVGAAEATSVGYGYATTVPYLRSTGACEPLVVLGAPGQLGPRAHQVRCALVTVAGPGVPALGRGGAEARERSAARQLAVSWPDEAMLARAGPRPLSAAARQRWEAAVGDCALERWAGRRSPLLERRLVPALPLTRGPAPARSGPGAMMPS